METGATPVLRRRSTDLMCIVPVDPDGQPGATGSFRKDKTPKIAGPASCRRAPHMRWFCQSLRACLKIVASAILADVEPDFSPAEPRRWGKVMKLETRAFRQVDVFRRQDATSAGRMPAAPQTGSKFRRHVGTGQTKVRAGFNPRFFPIFLSGSTTVATTARRPGGRRQSKGRKTKSACESPPVRRGAEFSMSCLPERRFSTRRICNQRAAS